MHAPLFGAFHALAIDDRSGRARFAFSLFPARDIKRVVKAIESTVATPQDQIVVHRALGRQVLGQRAPLAARAQDIQDPVSTSRISTVRLLPPGLAGGISGATCAHSAP